MPNRLKIFSKYQLKGDTFLNMPNNIFLLPTPLNKAKSMPNYDVHAKQHIFMPNHFEKRQMSEIWH